MTLKSLEKRVCKHHAACSRQIGYPRRLATAIPRVLGLWRQRNISDLLRDGRHGCVLPTRVHVCMSFVATCTMDPHILSVLSCRLQHRTICACCGLWILHVDNSQLPHQQTLSRNVQKTKKSNVLATTLISGVAAKSLLLFAFFEFGSHRINLNTPRQRAQGLHIGAIYQNDEINV